MARLSSDGPGRTGGESTWIAPYSPSVLNAVFKDLDSDSR